MTERYKFKSTKAGFASIFHRPENFEDVSIVGENTGTAGQSGRESDRESTSHSIDQQILKLCSKEDLSFAEIVSKLGYSHNNPYVHNRVVALRKLGLLEYTIPEKPNSRLQKYRLVKK